MARLLREVDTLELGALDRARATWIRESFDDGVPGAAAGARALAATAEQTLAAGGTELAVNLLGGAALRCWRSPRRPPIDRCPLLNQALEASSNLLTSENRHQSLC